MSRDGYSLHSSVTLMLALSIGEWFGTTESARSTLETLYILVDETRISTQFRLNFNKNLQLVSTYVADKLFLFFYLNPLVKAKQYDFLFS